MRLVPCFAHTSAKRTMRLCRAGLVFVLGGLAAVSRGQAPESAPSPARPPETLAQIVDQVRWDVAERGPLLLVDPAHTLPIVRLARRDPGVPPPPPPRRDQGGYHLGEVGAYFGRRLVAVGTLSVLAPSRMVVLNTAHLPPPDITAGLGDDEKQRLLFSSLTPAQWRLLGGPDGIGAADLDGRQRAVFTSLFSRPMSVYREGGGPGLERLTPQQQAGIRILLRRKLEWAFESGPKGEGRLSMGYEEPPSPTGERLRIGYGPRPDDSREDGERAFGALLREAVPARLKPGDLPFDWSALNAGIPLEGAATVGDLFRRVAEQTRVELYCDTRYAGLPVTVRGDSARAGDLLKAVCWAVSGTFRRVGTAYVLTDDLVGLGTRHALIANWINHAAVLAQATRQEAAARLRKAQPGDYIGWKDDDPYKPSAALQQKIEAQRARVRTVPTAAEQAAGDERLLEVAVSDLPPAAQEAIRGQLERYEKRPLSPFAQEHPELLEFQKIHTRDRVRLLLSRRLYYLIPGVGPVEIPRTSFSSNDNSFLNESDYPAPPGSPTPRSIELPVGSSVRALLVAPTGAESARRAVVSAKQHGFSELWVEAAPSDTALVESAVSAGKAEGIAVRAVLRVLRGAGNPIPPDINLLGETLTAQASRLADEPLFDFWDSTMGRALRDPKPEQERERRRGDWLRCDLDDAAQHLAAEVRTMGRIDGLAGVALRDLTPPGYRGMRDGGAGGRPAWSDYLGQFGYTPEMRLAFLRHTGVDPVDLSPLRSGGPGGLLNSPFGMSSAGLELPFFPDYGPEAGSYSDNGRLATELGAKDAWEQWAAFRARTGFAFANRLVQELRRTAPELPLLVFAGPDVHFGGMIHRFSTPDGGRFPDRPPVDSSSDWKLSPEPGEAANWLEEARLYSRKNLLTFTYIPDASGGEPSLEFATNLEDAVTASGAGWDGFVLDLSALPLGQAQRFLTFVKLPTKPTASPAR